MPESYTLSLTASEIDLIGKLIGKEPLTEVLALWMKLKTSILAQQKEFAEKSALDSVKAENLPQA